MLQREPRGAETLSVLLKVTQLVGRMNEIHENRSGLPLINICQLRCGVSRLLLKYPEV